MFAMMLAALLSSPAHAGTRLAPDLEAIAIFDGQPVTASWLESLAEADFRDLLAVGSCGTWEWSSENGAEQLNGNCVFLELGVPSTRVETDRGVEYRKTNLFMLEETPCVGSIAEACFHDTYRIGHREIRRTDPVTADRFTVDGVDVVMPPHWAVGWRQIVSSYGFEPGVVLRGVEVEAPSLQPDGKVLSVLAVGPSSRTTLTWTKRDGVWTDEGAFTALAAESDPDKEAACEREAEVAVADWESSVFGALVGLTDLVPTLVCAIEGDEPCLTELHADTGTPGHVRQSSIGVYQDAYDSCMDTEETVDECQPAPTGPAEDQTDNGGDNPCP